MKLLIEIKKKMDASGVITHLLYIDGVLTKTDPDPSVIKAAADTIEEGFYRGEFQERVIYSKLLDDKNMDEKYDAIDLEPSPKVKPKTEEVIPVAEVKP